MLGLSSQLWAPAGRAASPEAVAQTHLLTVVGTEQGGLFHALSERGDQVLKMRNSLLLAVKEHSANI